MIVDMVQSITHSTRLTTTSLEYVKLSLGKGKILAGINCPNLRTIEMNREAFSDGFREFQCLNLYKGFSGIHRAYERDDIDVSDCTKATLHWNM